MKSISENKRWYQRWWVILLAVILLLWSFGFLSNPFSGESALKEDYEVKRLSCGPSLNPPQAFVDMISLGDRKDQLISGLIYLYKDCPKESRYTVSIIEPTRECLYSFNGEAARLWNEGIGQDNPTISEESKRIIENDMDFKIWKIQAEQAYKDELRYGFLNLTERQYILSSAYQGYIKNGITETTIWAIVDSEMSDKSNCE